MVALSPQNHVVSCRRHLTGDANRDTIWWSVTDLLPLHPIAVSKIYTGRNPSCMTFQQLKCISSTSQTSSWNGDGVTLEIGQQPFAKSANGWLLALNSKTDQRMPFNRSGIWLYCFQNIYWKESFLYDFSTAEMYFFNKSDKLALDSSWKGDGFTRATAFCKVCKRLTFALNSVCSLLSRSSFCTRLRYR